MNHMTPKEIAQAVKQVESGEATLIDVRRDDEIAKTGRASDSVHLQAEKVLKGELDPDLPKDRPIYTHCGGGTRSQKVLEELIKRGYSNVHRVGGLAEWQKAGGRTVGPEAS